MDDPRTDALLIVEGLSAEEILNLLETRLTPEEWLQLLRASLAAAHHHQRPAQELSEEFENGEEVAPGEGRENLFQGGDNHVAPARPLDKEMLSWKVLIGVVVTAVAIVVIFCPGCLTVNREHELPMGQVKTNFDDVLKKIAQFYLTRSKRIEHWNDEKKIFNSIAMSHRLHLAWRKSSASPSFLPTCLGVVWLIWIVIKILQEEDDDREDIAEAG